MSTLLTRPQLAAKIKAKYPEYGDIDDYELVNKVVAKHPEYGEVLDQEMPDFAGVDAEGSSTAPLQKKFPPPPAWAPSIGPGKPLAPEPSTVPESLDRVLEAIGLRTPDPDRPGLSRTLAEEPLNESDFAGVGRGLINTAATAAAPFGMGAVAGISPVTGVAGAAPSKIALAGAAAGGKLGAMGGEKLGRGLGQELGIPEIGSVFGETTGGLAGGTAGMQYGPPLAVGATAKTASLGRGAVNLATSPAGEAALDAGTMLGVPFAGRAGAAARLAKKAGLTPPPYQPIATDLARATQMAKEAEAAETAFQAAKIADRQRGLAIADAQAKEIAQARIAQIARAEAETKRIADAAIASKKAQAAARAAGETRAGELEAEIEAAKAEARARAAAIPPEPPTRMSGSGTTPGPAFPPPPGMGASGPPPAPVVKPAAPSSTTGFKPTAVSAPEVTFTVGKKAVAAPAQAKPLPPPPTTAEMAAKLKAASTPQERGALIREWKAAGENVGEKLSTTHAEASPLDPEDLAHAKDFLKQAGGLEKALEIVKSAPGNSAAEIRSLSRALREAARAK